MALPPSDPAPAPGARAAMAKQLKVLLPPSFHKLRISDELAGCFFTAGAASGGGGGGEDEGAEEEEAPTPTAALVVSPFGKVWRVEVGRDGDGAFLGRGWAEFLAAHGVELGWFVVLRHQGGAALTVKVFDTTMCVKEFVGAPAAAMTSRSSKGVICKPQFIRIFHPYLLEKMILPTKFVNNYVTEECLNSQTAIVLSPLGKFWHIELKNDQSGTFFTGASQFLEFHGISNGDVLLLRYEGNMVFKFKAFGISGCQKDFKNQNARIHVSYTENQETPSPIRKRRSSDERSSSEENKRPDSLVTHPLLKEPYQIGTSSWIRKKITTYVLGKQLALSKKFCNLIGFRVACTITLKTEMAGTRSWQVRGAAYKDFCNISGEGWKSFCQDNTLKAGDLCTFNIIEPTLWNVTIKRDAATLADTFRQNKSPCSSSRDHKAKKGSSSSEGTKRPKSSMTSLSKVLSYTKSVYNIGPPSWIRKQMNTNSIIGKNLSLAQAFCSQIGLLQHCTITLKTSTNSNSWQIHSRSWQKDSSCVFGSGWEKFCRENNVKIGDVCTFNVIETTLWHVDITRC